MRPLHSHDTTEPVEDRGRMYRVIVPGTGRKEYFLVEYRDKDWRDNIFRVRVNWDQHLRSSGIAIWHVDERVGAGPDWPFAPPGSGQNDAPFQPAAPFLADGTGRPLVRLVQRDRLLQLEKKLNRGDPNDLYITGSTFMDDKDMLAGSRGYDGKETAIAIRDIDLQGKITLDEAREAVRKLLGLSESVVAASTNCKEGVYLVGDDPTQARVAYRVCVPAGQQQGVIHVYLDATDRTILDIQ